MSRIVGVDFGTTNTRLQLGYSDSPERTSPLQPPNADRDALPSVILVDGTGKMLEDMGRPAVRALLDPLLRDRVRYEFKPCLGRSKEDLAKQTDAIVLELRCPSCNARIPEGFVFCGKCGKPLPDDYRETIAERALKYGREEAFGYARLLLTEIGRFLRRSALGDGWRSDDLVVIGVPAHWTDNTRDQYAELVAEALGMDRVQPVDEPRAALAEYLWRAGGEVKSGESVLVVDMGGGTTDLVMGQVQEDGTLGGEVRTNGIRYGGADFDDQIVRWALKQPELSDVGEEQHLVGALRPVCRELKEELCDAVSRGTADDNPRVKMPFISREVVFDLEMDRALFESDEVAGPLIALFGKALNAGLAGMGARAEEVDHVILVGGGANAYFVADATRTTFPRANVVAGQQPEVAISRGLVLVTGLKPSPTAASETAVEGEAEALADNEPVPAADSEGDETGKSDEADKAEKARLLLAEAVRYIMRHQELGESEDEIRWQLRGAGWTGAALEKVWAQLGTVQLHRLPQATNCLSPVFVLLDGEEVDSIKVGEVQHHTLEPGIHTLQLFTYWDGRRMTDSGVMSFEVTHGSTTTFRCGFSGVAKVTLYLERTGG